MKACFVYVTAADAAEAKSLGKRLVEARLAACANVIDSMTSIYRWEGQLNEDSEAVLILKTQADLVDRLTAMLLELHSYDRPCVVALPVIGGSSQFIDWIGAETQSVEGT
jgi:periplasmic divalent cation tolerance protein